MARLTQIDNQGNWRINGLPWSETYEGKVITKNTREKMYGAFYKLLHYEDTGLDPEQIRELDELYAEKCKELAKHRWIPVTERLPEDEESLVLIQVSGKPEGNIMLEDAITMASYNVADGWILEMYPEWEDAHPVAWMPLPEPYKDEIVRGSQGVSEG